MNGIDKRERERKSNRLLSEERSPMLFGIVPCMLLLRRDLCVFTIVRMVWGQKTTTKETDVEGEEEEEEEGEEQTIR